MERGLRPMGDWSTRTDGSAAPRCSGSRLGLRFTQARHQHILHQRALARTRDARDHGQPPERDGHIDILQVAQARAPDGEELLRRRAFLGAQHIFSPAEIPPGGGICLPQLPWRAAEDHPPALVPGARPEVDRLVRSRRRHPFVLHEHHRPGQLAKGGQQALHIGRVLADGRLIQHVQHVFQPADQGQRQAHPLRLAAAEASAPGG